MVEATDDFVKPTRRDSVEEKKNNLPAKYLKFVEKHSRFWFRLNLANVLISISFGAAAYEIMQINYSGQLVDEECLSLRNAVRGFFFLHVLDGIFSCMTLCGLDTRLLSGRWLLGLVLVNIAILGWGQNEYFKSMRNNCINEITATYMWMMAEVLFFYMMLIFIICYFFRKYCQDPNIIKEQEDEEERVKKQLSESGLVVGLPLQEGEIELAAISANPIDVTPKDDSEAGSKI